VDGWLRMTRVNRGKLLKIGIQSQRKIVTTHTKEIKRKRKEVRSNKRRMAEKEKRDLKIGRGKLTIKKVTSQMDLIEGTRKRGRDSKQNDYHIAGAKKRRPDGI